MAAVLGAAWSLPASAATPAPSSPAAAAKGPPKLAAPLTAVAPLTPSPPGHATPPTSPSAPPPPVPMVGKNMPDWHNQVVYQIFPESFADSSGDGIGDLGGILQRVDYLRELGVDVVWLNPIYKSTHFDSGYDVTDYTDIDPQFGTMSDLYALRDALHARGMRLMMDIVLNHSSDKHPWYLQEVRVKQLAFQLRRHVEQAGAQAAQQILNLLADPSSLEPSEDPELVAAQALVAAFLDASDAPAVEAGYPNKTESLATMGRALVPCALRPAQCPGIEQPFDDFYIWRRKPNNWTSIFSGSAWHHLPEAGGYVMSLFSVHQVDLNWRNPRLRQAMERVVRVWTARGIDGLRLDSIGTLGKDPTFPDAPPTALSATGRGVQFFTHRPEVHRYMQELSAYYPTDFRSIGEVAFTKQHPSAPLDYAGLGQYQMNEVFMFEQMGVDCDKNKWRAKAFDPFDLKKVIDDQQRLVHGKAWLGNYFENHDQMRVVSRYGNEQKYRDLSAKLFATLLMTLEGTPYIYQGQELGMTNLPTNTFHTVDDVQDIEARNYFHAQVAEGEKPAKVFHEIATRSRDHVRSAMQWNAGPQAGFSKVSGPVRVNPNYTRINAAQQRSDPRSVWRHFQDLIGARHTHRSWVEGTFVDELPEDKQVFVYSRTLEQERTLVVLNIGSSPRQVSIKDGRLLPQQLQPLIHSHPDAPTLAATMQLRPWEAWVFVGR